MHDSSNIKRKNKANNTTFSSNKHSVAETRRPDYKHLKGHGPFKQVRARRAGNWVQVLIISLPISYSLSLTSLQLFPNLQRPMQPLCNPSIKEPKLSLGSWWHLCCPGFVGLGFRGLDVLGMFKALELVVLSQSPTSVSRKSSKQESRVPWGSMCS